MKNEPISEIERVFVSLWKTRKVDAFIFIAGICVGAFFEWDLVETFVFLVFLWSLLGGLSSRILAIPALAFLSATPILLIFNREDQAEQYAVYAYYFLVMAVIRAVFELREDEKKKI